MELSQSMSQKLSQKLVLTVAMKQSLKILQMPQHELYDAVMEQLKENPLLERDDAAGKQPEFSPEPLPEDSESAFHPEERDDKLSVEQAFSLNSSMLRTAGAQESAASPLLFASREQDFYEMLREQLAGFDLPPLTAAICDYLVDCINEKGYLSCGPEEVAASVKQPVFEVYQAMYFLQSLYPAGVAARTLEECLLLQLMQGEDFNAYTISIVKNGLELLADNRIASIAKLLKTDMETARAACDAVRRLNPLPSRGYFTGERSVNIIPDAMVKREGGSFLIQMNESYVPRLTLNETYCGMLSTETDGNTVKYIRDKMNDANQLIRCVGDRTRTLYNVIECIVRLQPEYFRDGRGLQPMTMNTVADSLELDVSTISRAVQEKYIICAGGTVPLRSLFTGGYATESGDMLSSAAVMDRIKSIVASENAKHPLSDESIRSALEAMSINISRRTVAKYREKLGIESSSRRRR